VDHLYRKAMMYRACLFCSERLGTNEAVESLTVGRRLAFDPERGRLWVVCLHCTRWNLVAMEERWEALEECERLFRASRLRVSGERLAMAHRPEGDGLDLIRIGRAPHAEVAAWRYGGVPGTERARRGPVGRVRNRLAVVLAGLPTGWHDDWSAAGAPTRLRLWARPDAVVHRVGSESGDRPLVCFRHIASAQLVRASATRPWGLMIEHERGRIELWGREALSTLGRMLAVVNGPGAHPEQVRGALRRLEQATDSQHYFSRVAALVLRTSWGRHPDAKGRAPVLGSVGGPAERLALHLTCRTFWAQGGTGSASRISLLTLPYLDRLALEMAATEETERKALQGELALLETAWREAEEIAEIADNLFRAPPTSPPRALLRSLAGILAPAPVAAAG
jgi:hypothetical protein